MQPGVPGSTQVTQYLAEKVASGSVGEELEDEDRRRRLGALGAAGRRADRTLISREETVLGLVSGGRSKKGLECHAEEFSSFPTGDQGPSCDLKTEDAR